jgi:hypothetical protein
MLAAYDSLVQAAHRLKTSVTDPEADLPAADLESEKTVRIGALFAFTRARRAAYTFAEEVQRPLHRLPG